MKFDAVYSNKVLMHLTKEELKRSLERQYELLNSDGILFHTFWSGEGEETFSGMLNVYYDEESLRGIFKTKFEILFMERYAEFDDNDSILIVVKKN